MDEIPILLRDLVAEIELEEIEAARELLRGPQGPQGESIVGPPGDTPKIGAGEGPPKNDELKLYIDTLTGDVWLNT